MTYLYSVRMAPVGDVNNSDMVTMANNMVMQQGGRVVFQERVCDICDKAVGDTKVSTYLCKNCNIQFDVAHDCKVENTDQCPPGYGCNH